MHTKLERFCDHVIEAGWLIAIVVVPLFFNVYSSRVFEPDKLTLLRSIVLVMVVAWLIRLLERSGQNSPEDTPHVSAWERIRETPLVLPTLLLVASYLISTLASVTPQVSLWGSYQRLQGTYTTFAYLVIFFLVLQNLRRPEQVRRLVTTAILVSLPISGYGLVQHYKWDFLPWGGDVESRVASNMGNAIFVAAYLIMVVPLTLSRLVESFSAVVTDEPDGWRHFARVVGYVFSLALQLFCVLYTKSRGPWMGLAAGAFVFVLLLLLVRRWKLLAYAWIALGIMVLVFLAVLNLPDTPLEPLRQLPYIGRLGQVFDLGTGTGRVRVLIWQGATELIAPHPPIEYPSGRKDALNPVRFLVGYGPEAMYVAYNRFYPPDLAHYEARNASPDRAHNETFDALVMRGLLGFLAYMILFTSAFYYGLRWIGAIATRGQRNLFIALWMGGGVAGATFFSLWQGLPFIGVGLPVGMALGLVGYLIVRTLSSDDFDAESGQSYQLLVIGLIAAIVAHFVEIHFGIAIAATRTYFWTYAGLMVVIGTNLRHTALAAEPVPAEPEQPPPKRRGQSRSSLRREDGLLGAAVGGSGVWVSALLMAAILVTMRFDYITPQASFSSWDVRVVWLFAMTWAAGSLLFLSESLPGTGTQWWAALGAHVAVPGVALSMFDRSHEHLMHAGQSARTLADILRISGRVAGILPHYYLWLLILLLAVAAALSREREMPGPTWRRSNLWLYPLMVLGVVVLVYSTNLQIVMADMVYKQAQPYDGSGRWDVSIPLYRRALQLAPREDFYLLFLGRAMLEKAKVTPPGQSRVVPSSMSDIMDMEVDLLVQMSRQGLLEASRLVLLHARTINPLNTDHSANLGRLYRTWAEMSTDPDQRKEKLTQAEEYYRQATSLSPNNAQLWNEWGLVDVLKGQPGQALEKYQRSLGLDQEYDQTYLLLGDLYMGRSDWEEAAASYRSVLGLDPDMLQAHSALGYIYAQQGKLEEAVQENLDVVDQNPGDFNSHKNLALLYDQLGDEDKALAAAYRAWESAPDDQKSTLALLVTQLGGEVPESPALDVEAYLSQGERYLQDRNWGAAEEAYLGALDMDPNLPSAHSALGYVYAQQGKLEEAVRENLIVLQFAPQDYNSHKNLALLYYQLGRVEEALTEAGLARDLAPTDQRPALEDFIAQLRSQSAGQ